MDKQIVHRGAEGAKRRTFHFHSRFEGASVLGQFGMRQSGAPMMNAVIRFMKQRKLMNMAIHPSAIMLRVELFTLTR
jgi:hypothetical protein